MNKLFTLVVLVVVTILWSCTGNTGTEKHQNRRNNITDVQERVQEIEIEDVMIGSSARLQLMDDYLVIQDFRSDDLLIHLFNRNNYACVTSAIPKGQGPGEITVMGYIGVNEKKREFYMSDHGKLKIFNYPLDSILNDPYYMPEEKKEIDNIQFPSEYQYINDTLSFARIIEPTGNVGHNEAAGKWNMQTGEVTKMNYSHPDVEKKRIAIAASLEHGIFVECYINRNLMTIMDLDGNLKYNIYGSNWNSRDPLRHYGDIIFRKDRIIVSYSGGNWNTEEYYPDKLLIFNLDGDYIKTLDIGYRIVDLIYDPQKDRLVFNFEDMIQFGYLALDDDLVD
ncbi:6-bladed beta-propeller [Proteiniphilum saccharofermentans]|uniref:6-bladed beta-propeller n=1 Tax=Proteiniphilum saccharofermentans TaxID=1642647 RepID=UPI0028B25FCC|nr:6-bladed beta-propeller [Proteiniphilum saccharofermentans]